MCKGKEICATDIIQSERMRAQRSIASHSTCLIHNSDFIGSGTFVECESHYGVLTAYHVVYGGKLKFDFAFGSGDAVGLSLTRSQHEFLIETDMLRPHKIGVPICNEEGPDMIFLEILDAGKIGTIKAIRSFWSIHADYEYQIKKLCQSKSCIWGVSGVPERWTDKQGPTSNFEALLVLRNLIGFGAVDKWFEKNNFDYFDMIADYSVEEDLPDSFGGISGGGLWAIPFNMDREINEITLDTPILSGVVFYQTKLRNKQRKLRAHGAKSIYKIFPKVLKNQ